ncbi:hypothetical protein Lal_00031442 [Lupinus albus]|nr:hypothetical protein Lal_00031442 [Lupinus albus]
MKKFSKSNEASTSNQNFTCFEYGKPDHMKMDCPNIKKSSFKGKNEIKNGRRAYIAWEDNDTSSTSELESEEHANLSLMASHHLDDEEINVNFSAARNLWYLDSGFSKHMTGDKSKFSVLTPRDKVSNALAQARDFSLRRGSSCLSEDLTALTGPECHFSRPCETTLAQARPLSLRRDHSRSGETTLAQARPLSLRRDHSHSSEAILAQARILQYSPGFHPPKKNPLTSYVKEKHILFWIPKPLVQFAVIYRCKQKGYCEIVKNRDILSAGYLKLKERLLHYFLSCVILPKFSNHFQISDIKLQLMYAIKYNIKINWTHMIMRQMWNVCGSQSLLPYAIFITKILEHFGVSLDSETKVALNLHESMIDIEVVHKMGFTLDPITHRTYKHQTDRPNAPTEQPEPTIPDQPEVQAPSSSYAAMPSNQMIMDELVSLRGYITTSMDAIDIQNQQIYYELHRLSSRLNNMDSNEDSSKSEYRILYLGSCL